MSEEKKCYDCGKPSTQNLCNDCALQHSHDYNDAQREMEVKIEDELLNAPVVFGLRAQGHIPTIKKMLSEGQSWDAIAAKIGWCRDVLKQHYLALPDLETGKDCSAKEQDEVSPLCRRRRRVLKGEDSQSLADVEFIEHIAALASAEQEKPKA